MGRSSTKSGDYHKCFVGDYVSLVEGAMGGQLFTAGIAALTDSEWFYFVSFLKALS